MHTPYAPYAHTVCTVCTDSHKIVQGVHVLNLFVKSSVTDGS